MQSAGILNIRIELEGVAPTIREILYEIKVLAEKLGVKVKLLRNKK